MGYRSMVQAMQKRYPKANIVLFAYPHGGSVKAYELYVEKIDELNAVISMYSLPFLTRRGEGVRRRVCGFVGVPVHCG